MRVRKGKLLQGLLAICASVLIIGTLPTALAQEDMSNRVSVFLRDTGHGHLVNTDVTITLNNKLYQTTRDDWVSDNDIGLDHGVGIKFDEGVKVSLDNISSVEYLVPKIGKLPVDFENYKYVNYEILVEKAPQIYEPWHRFSDGHKIYNKDMPGGIDYVYAYAREHNVSWMTGVDTLPASYVRPAYQGDPSFTVSTTQSEDDTITFHYDTAPQMEEYQDNIQYRLSAVNQDGDIINGGDYKIKYHYSDANTVEGEAFEGETITVPYEKGYHKGIYAPKHSTKHLIYMTVEVNNVPDGYIADKIQFITDIENTKSIQDFEIKYRKTEPLTPLEPSIPKEPDVPLTPLEPSTPIEPDIPLTPIEPGNPIEPDVPLTPLEPSTPIEPDIPLTPIEPGNPIEPDVPLTPLEPSTPIEPDIPLTPIEPGNPIEPDVPLTPLEPSTPIEPDIPLTPIEPGNPVLPWEPILPPLPTDPDIPLTPIEPGNPVLPWEPILPPLPTDPELPLVPLEPSTPNEDEIPLAPLEPSTPNEDEIPLTPLEPSTPKGEDTQSKPLDPSTPKGEDTQSKPLDPNTPDEISGGNTNTAGKLPETGVGSGLPLYATSMILAGVTLGLLSKRKED